MDSEDNLFVLTEIFLCYYDISDYGDEKSTTADQLQFILSWKYCQ